METEGVRHTAVKSNHDVPIMCPEFTSHRVIMASPPTRGRLLILFGSQTGCAEDVAQRLSTEAARRCYDVCCFSMDDYDVRLLPSEKYVVLVASTTGEGEVPDAMRSFWQFLLRKDLPIGSLRHMRHACFGLGDSSYPKFNYAAKRLNRRLEQLGSTAITPIGLGDDQDALGLDHALHPWLASLFAALDLLMPLPTGCTVRPEAAQPPARYHVQVEAEDEPGPILPRADQVSRASSAISATPACKDAPFAARVLSNERLTASGCGREVRHVAIDVAGWGLTYSPGDALAVQPRNPVHGTRALLHSLGLDPGMRLVISPMVAHAPPLPRAWWTVLELFTELLDVFSVPRASFFNLLSHFAIEPHHHERLAEFGAPTGAAELIDYAMRPRRTCAEVLLEFSSARPPLAYYLDLLPRLRARYFSISSSQALHPTQVHITVAVVRYQTRLQLPRFGVCSTYLAQLQPARRAADCEQMTGSAVDEAASGAAIGQAAAPADVVHVWLRRGCLTMPVDSAAPIVMIGPGTGVAPFRAFVQTRQMQWEAARGAEKREKLYSGASRASRPAIGDALLYFGCRHPDQDYLYAEEWAEHVQRGELHGMHVAFSRQTEAKVYVQHKIVAPEAAAALWERLSHPAVHVYIAGSANHMPKAVRKALALVAQVHGGMDERKASDFIRMLEADRRLQCETW